MTNALEKSERKFLVFLKYQLLLIKTYKDKISIFKKIQEGKLQEDILKTFQKYIYVILKNKNKV